jgi:hypothetical protein
MYTPVDLWAARKDSLAHLQAKHPSRLAVLNRAFILLDLCVDAFAAKSCESKYAEICGIALLKLKHLAIGSYSLILDGLGQETGALMRPMIEYAELLTYFRLFPESVNMVNSSELPKAGERAKAIGGIYKAYRDHLNTHASHSSFSNYSLSHLREPETGKLKKMQRMVPHVLEANVRDLVVQLMLFLREAGLALEPLNSPHFLEIADGIDKLRFRMLDVYGLNEA